MICFIVQGLALFLSDFTVETTNVFRIWDLSVAWDDATVFVHIPYLQPMGGIQSGVQLHETLNAVASAGVHVSIQPCPNSRFSIVISSPKHCSRTPWRSMRLPSRRDCNALCFNSIDLNAPAICELIQFWLLSSYHLTLPHRSAHSRSAHSRSRSAHSLTAPLCSLTLRSPR
jgi:hypothetical protein